MKKFNEVYAGRVDAAADYLLGKARNITTVGDNTGTPWEKILINDTLLGPLAAILSEAGIIPDGSDEKEGQSQVLDAIKLIIRDQQWGDRFKGRFSAGFTYETEDDVGRGQDGNYYKYVGSDPFPKVVAAGTVPSVPDYIQVEFNDHNSKTNRNAVGAHDEIYRRKTTVAEIESEVFSVDDRLELTDRSNAKFTIVSGGVANGSDIIDAGNGNTAQLEKGTVLIEMFGSTDTEAFIGAMNAIKDGRQDIVHGTKDRLYQVTLTSQQYCSYIEGNGCSIAITNNITPATSPLTFIGGVKNGHYLNNLNFYPIGDKMTPDSVGSEEKPLYDINDASTLIDDFYQANLVVKALDDVNDLDSWSDDSLKTRYAGFIRGRAKKFHNENIYMYGLGLGITLYTTDGEVVTHYEDNIKGYNVETLLWWRTLNAEPEAKFYSGSSSKISIINTGAQKDYWIGQNQGVLRNGKDVILDEADHTYRSIVSNISGSGIIERPVYNQSGTLTIDGVSTDNTGGGSAMLKYDDPDTSKFKTNNVIRNVDHRGSDAVTDIQIYGQDNSILEDFYYTRNNRSGRRSIELSRRNKFLAIRKGTIENAAVGIYFASQDAASKQVSVAIESLTFKNVYAGNAINAPIVDFRDLAADYTFPTATDLRFSNITVENNEAVTAADMSNASYQFIKVDGLVLDNVQGWFSDVPFTTEGCANVKVINSYFTQLNSSSISGAITDMKSGGLWQANQFDFTVESIQEAGNYPTSCKMRFKRETDSGAMVDCFPEWVSCEWEQEIPANTTIFENIPLAEYTSRIVATIGDSRLEMYQDGAGLITTLVSNIGTLLSDTDLSKYRIYNDGGVLRIRTTSTTLSGGVLKVKIYRT